MSEPGTGGAGVDGGKDPERRAEEVKRLAIEAGFDLCRIAPADPAAHADVFRDWVAGEKYGDMQWMARNPERRIDPRQVVDGARSVVVLALNYHPGDEPPRPARPGAVGRIARYAWNDDYHDLVLPRLRVLDRALAGMGGVQRHYVDTGPVLERDHASRAGLGWNGKSTVQIHRKLGTWFFLAELITTLELAVDEPENDHCGKCTRCIDACPTGAITAPHRLDARLCISYLTIEHKGSIPVELRPLMGDRIYGCDECLEVCPWNRFATISREAAFQAREPVFARRLRDWLDIDDETFRTLFRKSPIKRTKRVRFLRNVCVALGNVGDTGDLPALEKAAASGEPLIAEHAAWAIEEIQRRLGRAGRESVEPLEG